jgi:general secretion pathway protein C
MSTLLPTAISSKEGEPTGASGFQGVLGKLRAVLGKLGAQGNPDIDRWIFTLAFVIMLSYVLATISSSFIMSSLIQQALLTKPRGQSGADVTMSLAGMKTSTNFRDLVKVVKERNLFNSEGKFPDEKFGGDGPKSTAVFDMNAPCRASTLPIELLGTIYLGDPKISIATVKDKNYSEADIYRAGDEIVGSEGAVIAGVERQSLIINNKGVKECIELEKPENVASSDGFPTFPGQEFGTSQSGSSMAGGGAEVQLDRAFVEAELGPGFAKIMDAARFVPNTVDNSTNGFKVFSIKPGSLVAKIGLQNNDVVTQVNDTSLKSPDQGFAFYQSLQDEKEIRLQVLRGGTTPVMITVIVR